MFLFDEVDFVQAQNMPLGELWAFLPFGYLLTIAIETPILLLGLSKRLSVREMLLCGVWLTACTYPIVVLVLPTIFYGESRLLYLAFAETFAPAAECLLFWFAFRGRAIEWGRSFATIVMANLASFGFGEVMNYYRWFGLF
jgi:hypothetical protein